MPREFQIPPLPATRMRALQLVADDDVGLPQLLAVIETDPALTGAVMRFANSAASSPINRVSTARLAAARIGITETRRIIATSALDGTFNKLRTSGLDVDEFWRHMLAVAVLADAGGAPDAPTQAFTAGLLHDVGRVAMAISAPDRYADVVTGARAGADTRRLESQKFGADHAEWGSQVGRTWRLPDELTDAIWDHHGGRHSPLSERLLAARKVASSLGIGNGIMPPKPGDLDADAAAMIAQVGGTDALLARIESYRHVLVTQDSASIIARGFAVATMLLDEEPIIG